MRRKQNRRWRKTRRKDRRTSAAEQAPTLIATPLPIAEVGDRYANKVRDPFDGAANSPSNSNNPQPYRSGYADSNEKGHDGQPSRTEAEPRDRERLEPHASGGSRYGDAMVREPRHSEPRRSEPRGQDDRYSSVPRAELYPIAANDTPATQRYSSANAAVAPTGAIAPAAGIQREGDKYTVQPNDSFWIISQKAYGTGAFFKALYEHNRKLHPEVDEMKIGQILSVPDESVLRHNYPDLCPAPRKQVARVQQRLTASNGRLPDTGRVYTVEDGDTLFEIARHELGKTSRWAEIYDLNREVLGNDFDYLRPGTELILPADKSREENVTRQPNSVYPR